MHKSCTCLIEIKSKKTNINPKHINNSFQIKKKKTKKLSNFDMKASNEMCVPLDHTIRFSAAPHE